MPRQAEISPNVPDVTPDYVDFKSAPRGTAAIAEPPSPPPPAEGERAPALPNDKAGFTPVEGTRPQADPADGHREGECIPNIPDIPPELVDPALAVATGGGSRPAPAGAAADTVSPWQRRHLTLTVLLVALLGVVVFGQAISALALAASLPVWAQYLLLVPLGVCCLALVWVGAVMLRSWLRLRAMRQVDLGALEELRRRAETRMEGVEHFKAARAKLEDYLGAYPVSSPAGRDELVASGIPAETIETLAKGRDFLLDRGIDSRSWLEEFRARFQSGLDAAAESRIRVWALKAAGCVITSPLPLLDAVLILGISLKLIKDLSVIYNVRCSRAGALILLNRAIIAAFIAGVAENATEMAAEELSGLAGEGVMGALGARMAGLLGPKLGEGAVNAFFIHRLGRATIAMLQPLRP